MSVTVERQGSVSVVTLRWTEKRNALNPDDAREIVAALKTASAGSVLVITGEGAFCSGGDLPAFAAISASSEIQAIRHEVYMHMQAIIRTLGDCPVPTIAAIDGPAVGLGFDIALACDMRFIGEEGWMRQGWASAGLVPGVGGVGLLNRLNPSAMWQLVADQDRVNGPAAAALGLGEAVPHGLTAAVARGEKLATLGRNLLEQYVALTRSTSWPTQEHFELAADIQSSLIGSQAFREKANRILAK
jgi:enoyl-CoA hydratase